MSVTKTAVNRPTTVAIIFALLTGLGIYSIIDLPIDLLPEITPPILIVFTDYSGAGPEEVENTVTRPIESALTNVSNIDKITSTSSEGSSQIMVEFVWGTDMSEASNDVRDKLEFVKGFLPEEAGTPQIFKYDPSMLPILTLMIKGNRTPEELREIGEDTVQPRLEQIEGVAMASVTGGRQKVIRVEIPQNRLEAYGLTLTQIAGMLRGQNMQISAGSITEGNKNYLIRTSGEYQSIEEIRDTVIAYKGTPSAQNPTQKTVSVRLRDIGDVFEGYKDQSSIVYINGEPGVLVYVMKQSGTNSVQTSDNVVAKLDEISQSIPAGVSLQVVDSTTEIIRTSLNQVTSSAVTGALLAVIILLIFLRSFKSTLIIGISIPISFVITLMLMYFFDLTLNIMTLAGLTLGLGMLVDSSIVILENIYRYREKGTKLHAAAVLGSEEMINAIVASVLTTVSVFAPLLFFKDQLGIMGEMFSGLAFTIVISLLSSLGVAVFLVPVLASKYFPISSRKEYPLTGVLKKIDDVMQAGFTGLDNAYKRALGVALKGRFIILFLVASLFAASLVLIPSVGFEMMPSMQDDAIRINLEMPLGTKLELTESVLQQMEQIAREEIPELEEVIIDVGGGSDFFSSGNSPHTGSLTIALPAAEKRSAKTEILQQRMREHFNEFPAAVFSFSSGNQGMNTVPIDILVKTDDLVLGKEVAESIKVLLEERVPEATEPSYNLKDGLPQIEIFIDRDKAYTLGLNIASIGQEIRANLDGITASRYRQGGAEYDIVVILQEEDRNAVPDLQKIFVMNQYGQRIPLSSFAHLERTTGPTNIRRENQSRVIHVTAGLAPGAKLSQVEKDVRRLITEEIPADSAYVLEFSGEYAETVEYGLKLMIILLISVLLVFGVMASQFESFLDPFIILFTIPLTTIGIMILYLFTGEILSLFTLVGLIMLVGIVVNNGIVLVDYTNLLRARGLSIREACMEAGKNRLRPILMTSLTTILGLIPMSFFGGEGSEIVQPIGRAVVGGLTASTLLTLFVVPVFYSLFNGFTLRMKRAREARREKHLQKALKEQTHEG